MAYARPRKEDKKDKKVINMQYPLVVTAAHEADVIACASGMGETFQPLKAATLGGKVRDTQTYPCLSTFQPLNNQLQPNPMTQTLCIKPKSTQKVFTAVRNTTLCTELVGSADSNLKPQCQTQLLSNDVQVMSEPKGEKSAFALATNETVHEEVKNPQDCLLDLLSSFRAKVVMWFEETQAAHILQNGVIPEWFHGFISRRESEELLIDKPEGCFLVRLSGSRIGFALSYRGSERCRHFLIDQLPDGQYAILGEDSYHSSISDLLLHYSTSPIPPFLECLTDPCPQMPDFKPPLPTKSGQNIQPALDPLEKSDSQATNASGIRTYAKVNKPKSEETVQELTLPLEKKYTEFQEMHTYAEPNEGMPEGRHIYNEPVDPIAFYAMVPGLQRLQSSSDSLLESPENVYSEPDGTFCKNVYWVDPMRTLPPVPSAVHPALQRCSSNKARTLPVISPKNASTLQFQKQLGTLIRQQYLQRRLDPKGEFDDPVYGRSKAQHSHNAPQMDGQDQEQENFYESIAEGRLKSRQLPLAPRTSR
ncbi:SH2 domain-containing protein 2A [Protopterus annectens]|uniref:SH2 domain-containing protein 2A n=1 Tax=Protopterus annectens TaxID=7888 RepID=UPI001CF93ECA|nr:SH2 domain-containing protein 2A [Protopterus annectens]